VTDWRRTTKTPRKNSEIIFKSLVSIFKLAIA
jgi:hypothetical protein